MEPLKIGDKIKIIEIGQYSSFYPVRDLFKDITFIVAKDKSVLSDYDNGYNLWDNGYHSISVKTRSRNFYKNMKAKHRVDLNNVFHIYYCKSKLLDNDK